MPVYESCNVVELDLAKKQHVAASGEKRIDAAKQVGNLRGWFIRLERSNCQAKKTGGGRFRFAKFLPKLLNGRSQQARVNLRVNCIGVAKISRCENRAVFGFDTGKGLPPPKDFRDCPNLYTEGTYPMDVDKLRSQLHRAQLILGRVEETVPMFLATYKPGPIAFVSVDLDLYTSTEAALHIFEADTQFLLSRIPCYFDDIIGFTFAEHNGVRLAIAEFNQEHESRKISVIHGLKHYVPRPYFDAQWVEKFYMAHILDHELYCHNDGLTQRPRLDLVA
jgi:hypothetical protein